MRIGIYGGTFSPIHNGHVLMAESFIDQMKLDKLYVIPNFLPPHKQQIEGADAYQRLEMCKLAFDNTDKVYVSDIEIRRADKSYTVDTLRELKHEGDLYLLCGSDMFLTLETWREADEIFKLADIVLGRRENDSAIGQDIEKRRVLLEKKYNARIYVMDIEAIALSSSEIRENISKICPISNMVPAKVEDYIYENGLYRDDGGTVLAVIRERVRTMMSRKRYLHTLGVEREIIRLARIYCPDKIEKLCCAALLHDITKEWTTEKQEGFCNAYGISITDSLAVNPKLYHAVTGAILARMLYVEDTDGEILDAIRFHTTGRRDMTLSDMLLYLADYIEDTRKFEDCVALREYFYNGIDGLVSVEQRYVHLLKTLLMSFDMTLKNLENEVSEIDRCTLEARAYVNEKLDNYTN